MQLDFGPYYLMEKKMELFSTTGLLNIAQSGGGAAGGFGYQMLIFLPIIGIFYFLMWRPQQQRQKEHQELLKHLKVGDRVMTSGGMLGVIKQVSEKVVLLTTANGAEVEFVRAAIAKVLKEDDNDLSLDNNP